MPHNLITGLKPPGPLVLDSNIMANWKIWHRAYSIYATVVGNETRAERVQCSVFLHMAGEQTQKIFSTMTFAKDEHEWIEPLVKAFCEYCTGKSNIIITRYKFNTHNQTNETMLEYITSLRDKIKDCDYGLLHDCLLHDCIVAEVKGVALRNKLIQTCNLTLAKCADMCEVSEFDAAQLKRNAKTEEKEVDAIGTEKGVAAAAPRGIQPSGMSQPYWKSRMSSNNNTWSTCGNCGYTHMRGQCSVQGKSCVSCKKMGHFAKVCHSRPINKVMTDALDTNHRSQEEESTAVDELMANLFVSTINNNQP